jgi:transcriptional regulator with XRE-family HTH domain
VGTASAVDGPDAEVDRDSAPINFAIEGVHPSCGRNAPEAYSASMNRSINLVDLGRRVRAARIAKRLTLEEVVARAEFTVSWLSKLENGQLSPSLEGLVRLADVLECGLDSLVEGLAADPEFVVVKAGQGETLPQKNGRHGVTVESLANGLRDRTMQPTILHLSGSGTRKYPDNHEGERFLYVLEGAVRVAYGEERIVLDAGDSIYLYAAIPHALQPMGKGATRVLSVSFEPRPPVGTNGSRRRGRVGGAVRR